MYDQIADSLETGGLVILDGGTGTDIQRRGVPMDGAVWCAAANLTHGDVVRDVHVDYIRAGARVITANTYASSPLSFLHLGRGDEIGDIDRKAVSLARQAARETAAPVAVAGSISVMPPVDPGSDRTARRDWDPDVVRPLYRRKAEVLADAGCDLLIMEMMRDLDVSLWATEAAVATGLPVWVGVAVERSADGSLVSFGNHRWPLAELTRGLMGTGARAALVMHNEISTTDDALDIIRAEWGGPVGAYPESGEFRMPEWMFADTTPEAFAEHCRRWRQSGAAILGGCCGITPDHIRALAAALSPDSLS